MLRYGLVGNSLSHSFSKKYFEEKFKKLNLTDCNYDLFEISSIEKITDLLSAPHLLGLNITIPFKESIIPFLSRLDPTAESIGAVNTIKIITENGSLKTIGYNTDLIGFSKSLRPFLESHHTKALVLGTGGASKAVVNVLKNLGIDVLIVGREKEDRRQKTEDFTKIAKAQIVYGELTDAIVSQFPLIINCTPLGMYPNVNEMPLIPLESINEKHLVYDLIYNPEKTKLLIESELRGATIMNGLSMLHLQAEESWRIWNG